MHAQELRLLVRLVAGDHAGAGPLLADRPGELDRLAVACGRAGLAVVLLRALAGSPLVAQLGPERMAWLRERQASQAARQQEMVGALADLADRFARDHQPFILLKGPYLAARLYGDPLGREYADLDLLVPAADRARAGQLLGQAGYELRSRTPLGAGLTSRFVHAFDFTRGRANVDLHFALSRHPALRLDEDRLWARHRSFALGGRRFVVLADEDEVIFAALSFLRDMERGRPKPKNAIDLVMLAKATDADLAWDALLGASDGTAGPLGNVLALCLDVAAARDLAPRLAEALDRHRHRLVPFSAGDSPFHFAPMRLGLGNRLWSARTYDTNLAAHLGWWALSLPFRMAVHRRPGGRARRP